MVLQIDRLLEEDAPRLYEALVQSADIQDVEKVPLFVWLVEGFYSSSFYRAKSFEKVSEEYLRRLVQEIPGVGVVTEVHFFA
jgi:hypothetical protein